MTQRPRWKATYRAKSWGNEVGHDTNDVTPLPKWNVPCVPKPEARFVQSACCGPCINLKSECRFFREILPANTQRRLCCAGIAIAAVGWIDIPNSPNSHNKKYRLSGDKRRGGRSIPLNRQAIDAAQVKGPTQKLRQWSLNHTSGHRAGMNAGTVCLSQNHMAHTPVRPALMFLHEVTFEAARKNQVSVTQLSHISYGNAAVKQSAQAVGQQNSVLPESPCHERITVHDMGSF